LSVTVHSVLVQDKEPRGVDLDGDVVVLSLRAGSYFGFNAVASKIWRMLGEPCPAGEILDTLIEEHEVDADTLARDVMPFLQALIEQQLVRVIGEDRAR
jgi:hypothetical protein